jgi:hypothetical protein
MTNQIFNEQYQVCLQNDEPSHFEKLPHLLSYLTYIEKIKCKKTGKIIYKRKRLSPGAKELFRVIQRSAGKNGMCLKETKTLAWECNCSVGSIVKYKKELLQEFEQIGGKSLILKIDVPIFTYNEEGLRTNKKIRHKIYPSKFWNYNRAFMNNLKEMPIMTQGVISERDALVAIEKMKQLSDENVYKSEARSNNERASQARSNNERASLGARSNNEPKHTKKRKHLNVNKAYTEPEGNDMRFIKNMLEDICYDSATSLFGWFLDFGFEEKIAAKLAKKDPYEIKESINFMKYKYINGRKKIENHVGYLYNTIENKYYKYN